jgi:hypothetical protein
MTSGVAITPHPLNRPSPNERETSSIPSTLPSLKDNIFPDDNDNKCSGDAIRNQLLTKYLMGNILT